MAKKGKGGDFERETCRTLSLWWTEGERDDVIWRNRIRRTQKAYNAQIQEGDICATDKCSVPLFEVICVECKAGYSKRSKPTKGSKVKNVPHDVLDIIDGTGNRENSTILLFWKQTEEEAKLTGRHPFLIFKRDFHRPVACITGALRLKLGESLFDCDPHVIISLPDKDLFFYDLELFLVHVSPHDIMIIADEMGTERNEKIAQTGKNK